jgi:hypothetical protein
MARGYMGKLLFVDLWAEEIRREVERVMAIVGPCGTD